MRTKGSNKWDDITDPVTDFDFSWNKRNKPWYKYWENFLIELFLILKFIKIEF